MNGIIELRGRTMIDKLIGRKNNGIYFKLFGSKQLDISELKGDSDLNGIVCLTTDEAKELKNFLDENLK